MDKRDIEIRAREAERILQMPLVKEALEGIDRGIYEAFKRSNERDAEGLKNLVLMAKAHDKFIALMRSHIESGEIANMPVKEQNALASAWQEAKRKMFDARDTRKRGSLLED